MTLNDIVCGPWAIRLEIYETIRSVYERHLAGETADFTAIEAQLGRPLANSQEPDYSLQDGIATISVVGVLAKRMNLFAQISGGSSTEILLAQLRAALVDPAVKGILLYIDSPGGTVDGTQRLANAVFAARSVKPIVTVGEGAIASGAFWVGSQAQAVFLADATTLAGSIGIYGQHTDVSRANEAQGRVVTDLVAGKYKAMGSSNAPLSPEAREYLEGHLSEMYTVFVNDVARGLDRPVDSVLADLAEGRVFVGAQAVQAGLVHGIAGVDEIRTRMIAGEFNKPTQSARAKAHSKQKETAKMTLEEFKAAHPELFTAIDTAAFERGATAERTRIQGVEAQALPGHEALVATLKYDGKTTAGDAAIAVNQAQRAKLGAVAVNLAADATALAAVTQAAVTSTTGDPQATQKAADEAAALAALPVEERCKKEWDSKPALRAEFGDDFKSYLAFTKADAAGQVAIFGQK